ncbi:hypothetical protein BDAP_002276 [Binucleata daphniae]
MYKTTGTKLTNEEHKRKFCSENYSYKYPKHFAENACKHCGINIFFVENYIHIAVVKENETIVVAYKIKKHFIYSLNVKRSENENINMEQKLNCLSSFMKHDQQKKRVFSDSNGEKILIDNNFSKMLNLMHDDKNKVTSTLSYEACSDDEMLENEKLLQTNKNNPEVFFKGLNAIKMSSDCIIGINKLSHDNDECFSGTSNNGKNSCDEMFIMEEI